jgi:hypothetical protein
MIVAVFATLFLTLVLGWFGRHGLAAVALVACLFFFVYEFLWEVWSPEYGFEMPWIQTELIGPFGEDREGGA